jgi:hypothetical protein
MIDEVSALSEIDKPYQSPKSPKECNALVRGVCRATISRMSCRLARQTGWCEWGFTLKQEQHP